MGKPYKSIGTGYPYTQVSIDMDLVRTVHDRVEKGDGGYEFGGKIKDPGADSSEVAEMDIDCSTYIRYLVYRGTESAVNADDGFDIGEGSMVQYEYLLKKGFKPTSANNGMNADGAVRLMFLPVGALGKGRAGHVVLVFNGVIYESHSGTGPDDSRRWTMEKNWQRKSKGIVLMPPHQYQ